jgi:hypothetical protein
VGGGAGGPAAGARTGADGHDRAHVEDPAQADLRAREVLAWQKRCKLAHASLWGYGYERLKLAQLLGPLGVFLT